MKLPFSFFGRKQKRFWQEKATIIEKYLKQKQFGEAFQICQSLREKYKNTTPEEILYAGACTLFALGHVRQAEEWVKAQKAQKAHGRIVKHPSPYYLYLTAYLSLQRGQPEQALLDWTSILDMDPGQTFADKLIDRLKQGEKSIMEDIQDGYFFYRYIPINFSERLGDKNFLSKKNTSKPTGTPVFSLSTVLLHKSWPYRFFYHFISLLFDKKIIFLFLFIVIVLFFWGREWGMVPFFINKQELSLPKAPGQVYLTSPEKYGKEAPLFLFKMPREVIDIYEKARSQILRGKVNQARLLLRRIELGNINFEAKERALLLHASIPLVSLKDFHDYVKVEDVIKNPYLYKGSQILWTGRLRSIKPNHNGVGLELEFGKNNWETAKKRLLEKTSLIVDYDVSQDKKKKFLPKLNVQNKIQIFGIFEGIETNTIKVKAHELILTPP